MLGTQIGFTLSLAGIAGFIVAVGITADSFVVFFERIKDEVHEGRSVARRRAARLGARAAHDPVRRHGVVPRRRDPVLLRRRRREGLRVHARPVDDPRPGRGVPVHPPAGVAALAQRGVRLGPVHRAGRVRAAPRCPSRPPTPRPSRPARLRSRGVRDCGECRRAGCGRHGTSVALPTRRADATGPTIGDLDEDASSRGRRRARAEVAEPDEVETDTVEANRRMPSRRTRPTEPEPAPAATTPSAGTAAERAAARRARLRSQKDEGQS